LTIICVPGIVNNKSKSLSGTLRTVFFQNDVINVIFGVIINITLYMYLYTSRRDEHVARRLVVHAAKKWWQNRGEYEWETDVHFFFFRYTYRSRGPYLPHLQPPVIDKVTIDVEERDRLRVLCIMPTLVRPNTRPTADG